MKKNITFVGIVSIALFIIGNFSIVHAATGTISAPANPVCKINPSKTECAFTLSWTSDSNTGIEIWTNTGRFACTGNYTGSGIAYAGTSPMTFSLYTMNNCGATPNIVPDASHFLASTTVFAIQSTDGTSPIITINGSSTDNVPLTISGDYTDLGATANDAVDGSLSVTVSNRSDTSTVGLSYIIYSATDLSGNTTIATRTINTMPDTIAPAITILGSNSVAIIKGASYSDAGATASDNIDGDLTTRIATSSNVNTSVVGTYSVIYTVTDNAGNRATSTRTVNVTSAQNNNASISGGAGSAFTDSTSTATTTTAVTSTSTATSSVSSATSTTSSTSTASNPVIKKLSVVLPKIEFVSTSTATTISATSTASSTDEENTQVATVGLSSINSKDILLWVLAIALLISIGYIIYSRRKI